MCCQLKGYSKAAAPCTAALTVSLSWATMRMRLSRRRASMRDTMARAGRCQSRRAKGSPALAWPLPSAGGTSNSTNSAVLQEQPYHHVNTSVYRSCSLVMPDVVCGTHSGSTTRCSGCREDKGFAAHPWYAMVDVFL